MKLIAKLRIEFCKGGVILSQRCPNDGTQQVIGLSNQQAISLAKSLTTTLVKKEK